MIFNENFRAEINRRLNSDTAPVKCPMCEHSFTHVSTRALDPTETGTRQGGYAVLLEGECGHSWGVVYAEHKGQVVKVPFVFEAVPIVITGE